MIFNIIDKTNYQKENFKNKKLIKLFQECVKEINKCPSINNLNTTFNKDNYPEIFFPEYATIDLFFTENNELFNESFINENIEGENILGFCTLSDNDTYYESPTIFINLNSKNLYDFINENKDTLTKSEMAEEIVATLTHEVSHAIEYLECSGGMKPSDTDLLFEEGNFILNANEALNGYGMYPNNQFDNIEEINEEILEELMEERVELKGRIMLSKFFDNIDVTDKINAINELTPKKINRLKL